MKILLTSLTIATLSLVALAQSPTPTPPPLSPVIRLTLAQTTAMKTQLGLTGTVTFITINVIVSGPNAGQSYVVAR